MTKPTKTAALLDVELWLHDATPDTAAWDLLQTVRAALGRKQSTDESMKNACRHCGEYHYGYCPK